MWISIKNSDQVIWLAGIRSRRGILIYSAWQGLHGLKLGGRHVVINSRAFGTVYREISHIFRKLIFWRVRPVKIHISLHIRAVWSESSLGAFWIANDAKFLHADNEDWSDCADVQADLSLHWAHMSEATYSHVAAQILKGHYQAFHAQLVFFINL